MLPVSSRSPASPGPDSPSDFGALVWLQLSDWRLWGASFGVCTTFALCSGLSLYAWRIAAGHPLSFWDATFLLLINLWIDALLAPLVFAVTTVLPLSKGNWKLAIPFHVAGMICFNAVHMLIRLFIFPVRNQFSGELMGRTVQQFWRMFLYGLHQEAMIAYLAIIGVAYLIRVKEDVKEREVLAEQLRRASAEARIQALRLQLQPHFLFNTLHAVAELAITDTQRARRLVFKLADLLRLALDDIEQSTTTLQRELDFTRSYLEIQRVRLSDRLSCVYLIDPELSSAPVPSMILQPLVENSIRHSRAGEHGVIEIKIHAFRENDDLTLIVHNNGKPLSRDFDIAGTQGLGLRNVRARLGSLYPDVHQFSIANDPAGGVTALIRIPLVGCEAHIGQAESFALHS